MGALKQNGLRRIAGLLARIERRTGAIVVGIAGNREQLRGWRFDRVVGARAARARAARPARTRTALAA